MISCDTYFNYNEYEFTSNTEKQIFRRTGIFLSNLSLKLIVFFDIIFLTMLISYRMCVWLSISPSHKYKVDEKNWGEIYLKWWMTTSDTYLGFMLTINVLNSIILQQSRIFNLPATCWMIRVANTTKLKTNFAILTFSF